MNSDEMIKSIYNPPRKAKDPLFPKITKPDATSPAIASPFSRVPVRKYNAHNIFKQTSDCPKLVEEEPVKEQRDCQELQNRIAELMRRHNE
jgi:hypothetical protein